MKQKKKLIKKVQKKKVSLVKLVIQFPMLTTSSLKKFMVRILMKFQQRHFISFVFSVEVTSGASYEANKEKVKDSDNTVGERVGAGFSAVGDKIEEKAHHAKAEAHKEAL